MTLSGASDDMVVVEGAVNEEWDYTGDDEDAPGDVVAFSDGTVLRIAWTEDGMWRITPHARGTAVLSVVQAVDDGESYSDRATLTGEVRWVVHGRHFTRR